MTHKPQRNPHAANFLPVAATSSNRLNERERQGSAARVVHTTLIDEQWDPKAVPRAAHQSGARRIVARPPHTTLIDAEWDLDAPVSDEVEGEKITVRPPHTTLIDTQWDSPSAARIASRSAPLRRVRRLALDADRDPVITFVELEGPESLYLD